MTKLELVLKNSPVVLKIVEKALADGSPARKELLRLIIEGIDERNVAMSLRFFISNERQFKGE